MPSSAGTPAPLIEPQSAWNARLCRHTRGLDVLQHRRKHSEGTENAPKYAFLDRKLWTKWGGEYPRERDTASQYITPMLKVKRFTPMLKVKGNSTV